MSGTENGAAKSVTVPITADTSHLEQRELALMDSLVRAVRLADTVYLRQTKQQLLMADGGYILAGPFDSTRGCNYYPEGMTASDIKLYLAAHPQERFAILNPFTVVGRDGDRLSAIPYSDYYSTEYSQMSRLLRHASSIALSTSFRSFLQKRAEAFETNEYKESDTAWVTAGDRSFELTIGPYEDYDDTLFGVKRDFEGILGVVQTTETDLAGVFQQRVVNFDKSLSRVFGYEANPRLTPMVVMDEVLTGGRPRHTFVPMAFNLPNDPDIQQSVGSKKVFIRNVMRAKLTHITQAIGERVLGQSFRDNINAKAQFHFILGHEAAHGLSFRFDGEDFGPNSSALEEAKADIFGLSFLSMLEGQGVVPRGFVEQAVVYHLTDGLRQVRFGLNEAHALGTILQYNYFVEGGALQFRRGSLDFRPPRFQGILKQMSSDFYRLSQTRSSEAAASFIRDKRKVPEGLLSAIMNLEGVPVDIEPVFSV